jgi:hypothetical protein
MYINFTFALPFRFELNGIKASNQSQVGTFASFSHNEIDGDCVSKEKELAAVICPRFTRDGFSRSLG